VRATTRAGREPDLRALVADALGGRTAERIVAVTLVDPASGLLLDGSDDLAGDAPHTSGSGVRDVELTGACHADLWRAAVLGTPDRLTGPGELLVSTASPGSGPWHHVLRLTPAAPGGAPAWLDPPYLFADYRSTVLRSPSRALIVPRFVLGELQTLADSRDSIKRERGRRGLDILNQLQRSKGVELTIHDTTGDAELETDARLVRIAKLLQARLLTNDNALCQVARLQQVPALNLADLARALRPIVVAGDELELNLVKEGRDAHQAVGYLPDGTMIVVNHARSRLGSTAMVVVSSALQTAAGRLIFAELKNNAPARADSAA